MPLSKAKGFSLVEAVVILAIIAILCTVAVPGMGSLMRSYRLKSAANDLASLLQLARMTALARNADSVLSFNVSDQTVTLFVDDGASGGTSGDKTQNGGEATIKTLDIRNEYSQEITLGSPTFGTTVAWGSRGQPDTSGSIQLQNKVGRSKQIVLSPSGSVTVN